MHRISQVSIKNFKSCIDTTILLSEFTPLVGYNNAGKSNCLSAIQWLIRRASLSDKDFYDVSQPIEVVAIIEGVTPQLLNQLPPNQRTSVQRYVEDEKLRIRRLQEQPNIRVADIRLSVWDANINDWVPNPTGLDNAISVLLPEPIRIGAMENAAEDASKAKTTTTIGKLLAEFLEPVKTAHELELNQHLGEIISRISCNGSQRFS
ncbi:MAG: ATP-binding protein [Acinetobacter sp.]|nr:ATP-binding protein [Acinetobacter sp.]MDN5491369.1 ATP-binding protein [Acinetobacter sp.]MDN5623754.1 ATP-binding protein [Acinetobacter sp.]